MIKLNQILLLLVLPIVLIGQNNEPNPHDFGKMWTFENPPTKWFKQAYDFDPGQEWFDDVRKSSLRFASWCSASFVSPDGLIMTNHHCSRDVVAALQKDGENFDKQGFYANELSDERKADDLYVEQLIQAKDISSEVEMLVRNNGGKMNDSELVQKALDEIKTKYKGDSNWENLRLQVVTYYSGGRYSLYGYKRFNDIRLVWIPEVDLGFFGGDPDNFTYPRYNLDCTFWRAYDENGKPLNTSANYLKFNIEGAKEGEPVFVVGNPGSTERYRTIAQLAYDRDYRYPMTYRFLKNRNDMMVEEYEAIVNDPSKEFEAQAMLNQIANIANGMKAYGGIIKGLKDPELFGRKLDMENHIRKNSQELTYWDDLTSEYEKLKPHAWAITNLSPSGLRGKIYKMMFYLSEYVAADEDAKGKLRADIENLQKEGNTEKERNYFYVLLDEISQSIPNENSTLNNILDGLSTQEYAEIIVQKSQIWNSEELTKLLDDPSLINKSSDRLIQAALIFHKNYKDAVHAFKSSQGLRKSLEAKIANQAFKVYGTSLPPDATFTLRISDGIIKGYQYNGTTAPAFTTYFGLYNRHYSHKEEFPWDLPERWMEPELEFLKSKFNCVSTNDIIGGNSGSPLINKNKEAVGLIFDGNIESLPGKFIFDEKYNRTVSVHAAGIFNALKYIYKADRIVNELSGE